MSNVPGSGRRRVRFGVFEVDLESSELHAAGARLLLSGQPLAFLTALLERPGELVTRDDLRQRLWPDGTFVDFEHGLNAVVKRLRDALGDSADTPRFIETVPRRGYRFIAPAEELGAASAAARDGPVAATAPAPTAPIATHRERAPRWAPRRIGVAAGAAAVAVAATAVLAAWLLGHPPQDPAPPMRVVRLTALNGSEQGLNFAPDGRQFAFVWNGERQDNWDIYVKLVGSSELRRLTTDAAPDLAPQWSPDGLQIAYVHIDPASGSQRIRIMSSLGGADRTLSDFAVDLPARWSPDGRYLVAARASSRDAMQSGGGLFLVPVDGGPPRALTRPAPPRVDQAPAFSPDGRRLAYASCEEPTLRTACRVFILDVDATYVPLGPPRALTPRAHRTMNSLTWSSDGAFVVYSAEEASLHYLWRVAASGGQAPERIEIAGANAIYPWSSAATHRLAFSRFVQDEDIYRLEPDGSARPLVQSPAFDSNPQFSPDGRRIAFCSLRSNDAMDVWVADADGSAATRLTHGPGSWQCGPTWSPDGLRIAFDSRAADGSWHVWTADVDGGTLQQITTEPGDQNMPTWSADGAWIYFSWKQGDDRDIWRIERRTGARQRVTRGGTGLVGRESADGNALLYQPGMRDAPLLAQPLAGGEAHPIVGCVTGTAFAVTRVGVFYVPCSSDPNPVVRVRNPDTGADRDIGRLAAYQYADVPSGFAVSPDGSAIVYARLVHSGVDLMMIENFR
jgi:Tol biopolymer transport system component/DNA-binding winged helix-turn-helix (wHTH) protein